MNDSVENYFTPKQRAGFNFPGLVLSSKGYPKYAIKSKKQLRSTRLFKSCNSSPKRRRQKTFVHIERIAPKVPNPTPVLRYVTVGGNTFKVINANHVDKTIPFYVK